MDIITYALCKKYTDSKVIELAGALKYKGSKEKVSDLPAASSSNKGHVYTISGLDQPDYGHEYVSDGTQWIDLGADLNNKQDKLVAGENITIAADGKTISAQQPDISGKADLPSELPPELKAEGVDYPWFMINMNPTGIDADANLHLVHSGYNFNSKQYFTWPEKVLPMAASTTNGGLMTAADKIKLDAAITDISGKQDKLTAGNGISLDNNTITIKPADRSISVGEFGVHVPVITTSLDVTDNGLAVKLADDTIEAYNSGTGTKGIRVNKEKIQSKLTAGDGINIDINNKISANVRTYKPFPSSWPVGSSATIASFCAAVNTSFVNGDIAVGDAFLGNVNSTAFFSGAYLENGGALGSAEVSVQIMSPWGTIGCVQLLTTTSSNNAPYHWEYTYVDGATSEGWRCWSQHSYINNKLSLKQDKLPDVPNDNGIYVLKCNVSGGVKTYQWVKED